MAPTTKPKPTNRFLTEKLPKSSKSAPTKNTVVVSTLKSSKSAPAVPVLKKKPTKVEEAALISTSKSQSQKLGSTRTRYPSSQLVESKINKNKTRVVAFKRGEGSSRTSIPLPDNDTESSDMDVVIVGVGSADTAENEAADDDMDDEQGNDADDDDEEGIGSDDDDDFYVVAPPVTQKPVTTTHYKQTNRFLTDKLSKLSKSAPSIKNPVPVIFKIKPNKISKAASISTSKVQNQKSESKRTIRPPSRFVESSKARVLTSNEASSSRTPRPVQTITLESDSDTAENEADINNQQGNDADDDADEEAAKTDADDDEVRPPITQKPATAPPPKRANKVQQQENPDLPTKPATRCFGRIGGPNAGKGKLKERQRILRERERDCISLPATATFQRRGVVFDALYAKYRQEF